VERVSALVNLQWAFFFFNFFTRKLLGYKNTVSILKQSKSEAKKCVIHSSSVEGGRYSSALLYHHVTPGETSERDMQRASQKSI
jgi:hypothetical protein